MEGSAERVGSIHKEFGVVHNDRKIDNMVQLLHLRNLFSKALVKMPRDYVVRMIFDRRHHTFTMYRENGTIVGGLCFRPFAERGFAEVVFLAISQGDQVKGKGTRLMNFFKEYCKYELGIHYLLTYADNFATGYFKKQGFTVEVTLPNAQWKGYIKDYDGGTMMGCRIYQHIDYRNISSSMKEVIKDACTTLANLPNDVKVNPGFTTFPVHPNLIPGVDVYGKYFNAHDDGWTSRNGTTHGQIASILNAALKEPFSLPFRDPVSDIVVPGYSSVIKNPMDLSSMKLKNDKRMYSYRNEFRADVKLMIDNCVLFNGPRHDVTRLGNDLVNWLYSRIDRLVEYSVNNPSDSEEERENSDLRKKARI